MTSAETTPSSPAHAGSDGDYRDDQDFGRGSYQLPPDGGPAPAGSAGPTAAEDAPVLLPVDPPDDSRRDDVRNDFQDDSRNDSGNDFRNDDLRGDDLRGDGVRGDGTDGVADGVADDRSADHRVTGDDVLPGEDRPAADYSGYSGTSGDQTDGLPGAAAASGGSGLTSSDRTVDWHELQSRFVDDPAAAVREAAEHVERALSDLRDRIGKGDTEELRTAFKRYRAFYSSLS